MSTKFSDFTEKTDPTDAQWVGLDGAGANARFPASTFMEPIRGDQTWTVGTGQDYATLDAAFLRMMERAAIGGTGSSLYADKRAPRVTLVLHEDQVATAPNGYLRLEGIPFQVQIQGTSKTIGINKGGAGNVLQFTNCANVRFDTITLGSDLSVNSSEVLIGDYANPSDPNAVVMEQSSFVKLQYGGTVRINDDGLTFGKWELYYDSFIFVFANVQVDQIDLLGGSIQVRGNLTLGRAGLTNGQVRYESCPYSNVSVGGTCFVVGGNGGASLFAIITVGERFMLTWKNANPFDLTDSDWGSLGVTPGLITKTGGAVYDGVAPVTLET